MSDNSINILHYGDFVCYGCKEIIEYRYSKYLSLQENLYFHIGCFNPKKYKCFHVDRCSSCYYVKKFNNGTPLNKAYNFTHCRKCPLRFCLDCGNSTDSAISYCKDCENM